MLSEKHRRFVQEYLRTANASAAARAAGYSERNPAVAGARLLRHPEVKAALAAAMKAGAAETEKTAEEVLLELGRLATSDVGELLDERGCVRPLRELPEGVRRAVSSFEVEETLGDDGRMVGRVVKVKLWNKVDSLRALAQRWSLLVERREVELGAKSLAALLAEAGGTGTLAPTGARPPAEIHPGSTGSTGDLR